MGSFIIWLICVNYLSLIFVDSAFLFILFIPFTTDCIQITIKGNVRLFLKS